MSDYFRLDVDDNDLRLILGGLRMLFEQKDRMDFGTIVEKCDGEVYTGGMSSLIGYVEQGGEAT